MYKRGVVATGLPITLELPVRTADVAKNTFLSEMSPLQNGTSAIEDKVFT